MELSCSNIEKLLIFSQRKAFLIFCQKKAFVIFQETETSKKNPHILENENPEKILCISGYGTFLYLKKRKPEKLLI